VAADPRRAVQARAGRQPPSEPQEPGVEGALQASARPLLPDPDPPAQEADAVLAAALHAV
ncbi:hypothetical protein HK405_012775, partial [Cladochytrium tenue]